MKETTYIFGIHPVIEALKNEENIDKVFLIKDIKPDVKKEILHLASKRSIPIQFVPAEKLRRLVNGAHQGVVATVAPITFHEVEHLVPWWFENGVEPTIVILDEITDVRNFGAITRTADGAGLSAVIIPWKNSAQINAQTVKASAGALYSVPICRSKNLEQTVKYLKNSGFKIISCTEKAVLNYTEDNYLGPVAIILGSEEYGISAPLLQISDTLVRIPMKGSVGSLNVSVASAIIMYEMLRQREV